MRIRQKADLRSVCAINEPRAKGLEDIVCIVYLDIFEGVGVLGDVVVNTIPVRV